MTEAQLKVIYEHFKDELLGMVGTDEELVVGLKSKEVTIKDYQSKSVDEIIKEIKEG